jgi:nucleoside-diphosphate-sugar epimerase
VSPHALTLRGFAEAAAGWFGREPDLEFLPFDQFRKTTTEENAQTTYEHVARSHSVSITKAEEMLGYRPAYTSLEAVAESVEWLRVNGRLGPGLPPVSLSKDGS